MAPHDRSGSLASYVGIFALLPNAKPNVPSLQTAVLPDGSVVKTRSRARKSSAGFDTTKLFIGAEGTLGIVTEGNVAEHLGINSKPTGV